MCFRNAASTHYSRIVFLSRGWQTFSVKGKVVNISGLVGCVVSVVTTQPWWCGMKVTIDNK